MTTTELQELPPGSLEGHVHVCFFGTLQLTYVLVTGMRPEKKSMVFDACQTPENQRRRKHLCLFCGKTVEMFSKHLTTFAKDKGCPHTLVTDDEWAKIAVHLKAAMIADSSQGNKQHLERVHADLAETVRDVGREVVVQLRSQIGNNNSVVAPSGVCYVCYDTGTSGVFCPNGTHYQCEGCFKQGMLSVEHDPALIHTVLRCPCCVDDHRYLDPPEELKTEFFHLVAKALARDKEIQKAREDAVAVLAPVVRDEDQELSLVATRVHEELLPRCSCGYITALFDACAALTCPQCARMVCMVCFLTGDDSNAMHLHIRQSHPEGSAEDWRPSAFLREPYVREKQRQVRLPYAKAFCLAQDQFPAALVIKRCSSFVCVSFWQVCGPRLVDGSRSSGMGCR